MLSGAPVLGSTWALRICLVPPTLCSSISAHGPYPCLSTQPPPHPLSPLLWAQLEPGLGPRVSRVGGA